MALWINDGLHEAAADIHSFLLVGQSNMAGRGDLTKENAITAPDCFMLRMGRWQEMSEPINVDRAVVEGAVPRSGANLAVGSYYVSKTNDLLPKGTYTFGEDGKMVVNP